VNPIVQFRSGGTTAKGHDYPFPTATHRTFEYLRPISPPRELDNVSTNDQRERLLNVVLENGPWKLIIAQKYPSFEDLMATMSGAAPEGIAPSMESYVTPTFRGYIANYSTSLYPEINDCFYNDRFLDLAKSHRKAQYAKPQMMLSRSRRAVSASLSHDPAAVRLIARTLGRLVASAWAA